jgi:hypothetical protein
MVTNFQTIFSTKGSSRASQLDYLLHIDIRGMLKRELCQTLSNRFVSALFHYGFFHIEGQVVPLHVLKKKETDTGYYSLGANGLNSACGMNEHFGAYFLEHVVADNAHDGCVSVVVSKSDKLTKKLLRFQK